LEAKIVTLRKDLQKKNMQNNSKVLDDIIRIQNNRVRNISKIFAEKIKGDRKIYKEDYRDTPPPIRFIFQNQ
jgi:hypothetical protein